MIGILQGSARTLRLPVVDQSTEEPYLFLASALRVEVVFFEEGDRTEAITLGTDTTPDQIELNAPEVGTITVDLSSTDTSIDMGRYGVLVRVVHAPDGENTLLAVARRALRILDPLG